MKNYFDFTGRVALVTGASSGLGHSFALSLAEQGASIAAFARRKEKLAALKETIESNGGNCLPVVCDVSQESQIIAGVQQVIEHYGKIDTLINNAGSIVLSPTTELSLEKWQSVVDLSLTGYFLMAR